MTGRAPTRETAASAAQYLLLGGFAAVAAGISAQGLTGFARDNMALRGPWPSLLFLALDGAAGVCAVLLTRRAARAESGLAPRLAVWGLVTASASFNWTHAPHHPGAPEAFGLMPVIGAVLFEFTLRELRLRTAGRADRQLTALHWLHPAERIRVQILLAADERTSAQTATRRVRVNQAARRLYQLRLALHSRERAPGHEPPATRRIRAAERRAHAALTRAGFADPNVAVDVLRQVQVLTRTTDLARLDYTTADAARAVLASLITPTPHTAPSTAPAPLSTPRILDHGTRTQDNGMLMSLASHHSAGSPPPQDAAQAPSAVNGAMPEPAPQPGSGHDANLDCELITAAAGILAEARRKGHRLSQKALGDRLRRDGHRLANQSLHALIAAASPVAADIQANGGRRTTSEPAAPAALHPAGTSRPAAMPAWPDPQAANGAAESAASPS